jgi:hypothetical protein
MLPADMSRLRLLPLAAVALAATACGSTGANGDSAARVVKGDWDFNHDFTGSLARYADYETVEHITCTDKPDARGEIRCALEVSSAKRHDTRRVRVVVHYDRQGILQGWDLRP